MSILKLNCGVGCFQNTKFSVDDQQFLLLHALLSTADLFYELTLSIVKWFGLL